MPGDTPDFLWKAKILTKYVQKHLLYAMKIRDGQSDQFCSEIEWMELISIHTDYVCEIDVTFSHEISGRYHSLAQSWVARPWVVPRSNAGEFYEIASVPIAHPDSSIFVQFMCCNFHKLNSILKHSASFCTLEYCLTDSVQCTKHVLSRCKEKHNTQGPPTCLLST
ncbi:hypothetical protein PROFUN_05630 [Planoprotostelium fungivorum]|uniref:Uncharacterized protein n=1 Tax=Planoprotostelium fungivorum TaxID=1890364 RepID=A0A2P6MUE0_9EUKA|nr:hypothetical protein PROFUN_05630 [Planoprotostelium fungivorum]